MTDTPKGTRLNKYISNAGICSRRKADEFIKDGHVTVNGEVITEMGHRVQDSDKIEFKGKPVSPEEKVYILMNKPKDTITTTSDEKGRKTVLDLLGDTFDVRLYPVGRLDRATTGLLILTNDGELAQNLSHPSFEVTKIYHAKLHKPFTQESLQTLRNGIELDDGPIAPDKVEIVEGDGTEVGLEIHSGKNRIIRRIFDHLGYEVLKLDRVLYAGLTKRNIPRGQWRLMTEKEVGLLKRLT